VVVGGRLCTKAVSV